MSTTDEVIFYWRPGCPFSESLERGLDEVDLPLDRRNIWEDPEHAAALRAITGGNETVPTVVIGDAQLVNPTATEVLQAVSVHASDLLPDDFELPEESRVGQLLNRLLGG